MHLEGELTRRVQDVNNNRSVTLPKGNKGERPKKLQLAECEPDNLHGGGLCTKDQLTETDEKDQWSESVGV